MRAVLGGKTEVVVELIKAGAKLNLQDEVQRLSILHTYSTCKAVGRGMVGTAMNKTTLHIQVIRASLHNVYFVPYYIHIHVCTVVIVHSCTCIGTS